MIVLLHVLIALSSIVCTGVSYISPSQSKLWISYSLVALTLISGTYLVISTNSPLLSSCTTGLIYLAVVTSGLVAAHRKLAAKL